MKFLRHHSWIIVISLITTLFVSCNSNSPKILVTKENVIHPCLLLRAGEEQKIKKNIEKSAELRKIHDAIIKYADQAVLAEPWEYQKEGKRLLHVSRHYGQEITYMGYAYRMTGDKKYIDAVIKRLLKAASFKDWNPSHFLDTGEMAVALAVGYDWFYDVLPEDVKVIVAQAIEQKGWDESLEGKHTWWKGSIYNWNQVCNSGLVMGALTLYDRNPEKAQKILDQYYETIKLPMGEYGPDGCYPEGFGYWNYGTFFNCIINQSLYSAGLEPYETSAFMKSAQFCNNMISPTGSYYNFYDDCPDMFPKAGLCHAIFYFAGRLQDKSILWYPMKKLHEMEEVYPDQYLPLLPIFTKDLDMSDIEAPTQRTWSAQGATPIFLTRSACNDSNATFFAVKGGRASISHGHLDAGSFIFESNGERWAYDLGSEVYYPVEAAGVDLWTMKSGSERWSLLKYNNKYHNTITLNDEDYIAEAFAPMIETFDTGNRRGAVIDITPVLKDVKRATRNICLFDDKILEIRDSINVNKVSKLQWTLVTMNDTKISIENDNHIVLERNGKFLAIDINAPVKVKASTWSCKSDHPYEKVDATCLGFFAELQPDTPYEFFVTLTPMTTL